MTDARSIIILKPADTPDYMTPAWVSCIGWAIGKPEIVAAFRADAGNKWEPARDGLSAAIDKATGAAWEFVNAFTLWANEHVWGPLDGEEPDHD